MQAIYITQHAKIAEIVRITRFGEEGFLHDDKQIATEILKYLADEGMLSGKVVKMEAVKDKVENY